MLTVNDTQRSPNFKARVAWSMGVLIALGLLLPFFQPVQSNIGPAGPIITRPPSLGWPVAAAAMILAVLPWIPRRFSLRALLILMTLVAVGLGLCAWMARNNSLTTH